MKKFIALILSVLMIISVLTACQSDEKEPETTEVSNAGQEKTEPEKAEEKTDDTAKEDKKEEAEEAVEVDVLEDAEITWLTFETPNLTPEFYEGVIARFNEKYPNVIINREIFPTGNRGKHVSTLYATGQLPDVIQSGVKDLASFDDGLVELPKDFTDQFIDGVYPSDIAEIKYVPNSLQVKWGVYYNKSVFAENNIKEPTNWDEFVEVCAALKENGITPLVTGGTDKIWLTGNLVDGMINLELANEYGSYHGFNKAMFDGESTYDGPLVTDIFKRWNSLIDNGYYYEGSPSLTMPQMNDVFFRGESAMLVNGVWLAADIDKNQALDFEVGWFPIPTKNGTNMIDIATGDTSGVSAGSEYVEQSIAFLRFFFEDVETYSGFLSADGNAGVLKSNPDVEYSEVSKMVYEIVNETEKSFRMVSLEYKTPKGFNIFKAAQNVFAGSEVAVELEKLQKEYMDGLKMEERK